MNDSQQITHHVRRLTLEDRRRCWRRLRQLWVRHQRAATETGR